MRSLCRTLNVPGQATGLVGVGGLGGAGGYAPRLTLKEVGPLPRVKLRWAAFATHGNGRIPS
jgi:hypothetical protein